MILDEIADYLSTGGLGTVGTDLFKAYLPEQPDAAMVISETGGTSPYRAMRSVAGGAVAERPRIQVMARAAEFDYAAARLKINNVMARLDGAGDLTLNGVRYLWIAAVQSPFPMGRDDQGRVRIGINFDVVKALSTA